MDARILAALRNSAEAPLSGMDLAQLLGISRAAVWARIESLRQSGFGIEASPHTGYRLVQTPEALHADDLRSRLPESAVIGARIHVLGETSSTNDMLEERARQGAPEGTVVFAESQTRGRGRLGRVWHSPPGQGLWFSVLLRPKIQPQAVTRITIATASGAARALTLEAGIPIRIKWPNDLMIESRKVGGILTELSAETDGVKHVIVGIGIDVNQSAADFPPEVRKIATSLSLATGQKIDRARLASVLLRELDADYARLREGRFSEVAEEWEEQCSTLGRLVRIETGGRRLIGVAESIDAEGALLVRTEHGHLERVIGGDVALEK
ncbi:MAG: biotin--[acetyl-CoA-carboxylase] ligase [Verrucomicrobia bacterium]|nr:biotin--[acetyl-CoA-carboxylase] ligase [Verrucomicrobiota bacterium]